ncbi:HlyD family type I secretion periplasmic adaptor subunit [Vibrio sp. 10N.261.52.A1]|uniref:HlyD family type I secretion periplasmic adaptor subunit n=1 Tax=Vibrio TaxID=662 RepID=UPI000C86643A|nr:HlyD family type I secretion periplasmic adaptor subunit [Vibrio sp. 10N.261.52.A1]
MKKIMLALWQRLLSKRKKTSASEYEFLPAYLEVVERPASPLARTSAMLITLLLVGTLIWSIVGQLGIHASATGQVIVSGRSKFVQPVSQGEVQDILVKDGQHVEKGEILIRLNPTGAKAELARVTSQYHYTQMELARYRALTKGQGVSMAQFAIPEGISSVLVEASKAALQSDVLEIRAQMESVDAELAVNRANYKATKAEIRSLETLLKNVTTRLSARQKLAEKKSIAQMEVMELEKELLDNQRSKQQQLSRLNVLNAEQDKLMEQKDTYLATKRKEFQSKLNELEGKQAELRQELVKVSEANRLQQLIAPVSGTIQQLQANTQGGVVQAAEKLMVIVPDDALLDIEVMLLNKDVGFVVPGQIAEVKVDTFPYTKYGTLSGTVITVSRDAVKDEKLGLVFPARIRLAQNTIDIEGRQVAIQPGMSVVAEIKTGKRRVIEYLLSPLQQYQAESLRER